MNLIDLIHITNQRRNPLVKMVLTDIETMRPHHEFQMIYTSELKIEVETVVDEMQQIASKIPWSETVHQVKMDAYSKLHRQLYADMLLPLWELRELVSRQDTYEAVEKINDILNMVVK